MGEWLDLKILSNEDFHFFQFSLIYNCQTWIYSNFRKTENLFPKDLVAKHDLMVILCKGISTHIEQKTLWYLCAHLFWCSLWCHFVDENSSKSPNFPRLREYAFPIEGFGFAFPSLDLHIQDLRACLFAKNT